LREVDPLLLPGGVRRRDPARPGDELSNRLLLGGRKVSYHRVIGEEIEDGALAGHLGTEIVHHTHGAITIGAQKWMVQVEAHQELVYPNAAVNQVDAEVAAVQRAIPIFELIGRDDLRRV